MSYSGGKLTREQRIRLESERLQLYNTLTNLRDRERTYIDAGAAIPKLSTHQTDDIRRRIDSVENTLLAAQTGDSPDILAHRYYKQAFDAELAGDTDTAIKLYKKAARYEHKDAEPAIRSLRHRQKQLQAEAETAQTVFPAAPWPTRRRWLVSLAVVLLVCVPLTILATNPLSFFNSQTAATSNVTITPLRTPTSVLVQLITPILPPLLPTFTATAVPPPTDTPAPVATFSLPTPTPTPTDTPEATPTAPLRPPPRMIGPRDNLVWNDGAIVFEFEPLNLADDELYCLDTLRGYDGTNTENWSYPSTGSKKPFIAIQANVLAIAKAQGMQCIVWSAGIGEGTCTNITSELTPKRIIGLPRPCIFDPN